MFDVWILITCACLLWCSLWLKWRLKETTDKLLALETMFLARFFGIDEGFGRIDPNWTLDQYKEYLLTETRKNLEEHLQQRTLKP